MIITASTFNASLSLLVIVALSAILPASAAGQQIYDARTLTDRAVAERAAGDDDGAIRDLRAAVAVDPGNIRTGVLLAETLAWARRFGESEMEYRRVLESDASRDVRIGLSRVLLWQGRYGEARRMFLQLAATSPGDLDALEGAATAAYWSGDYRTASREMEGILRRDGRRDAVRQYLDEIGSASRAVDRIDIDGTRDDQPYRFVRAATSTSFFTDPLTRWDAAAGSLWMHAIRSGIRSDAPFVTVGNETTLPSHGIIARASLGVLRYPDGVARPIGSVSISLRVSLRSAMTAAIEQREILGTATAVDRHVSARSTFLQWRREHENEWSAAVEARRIRYSDTNRGWSLTGYALAPFATVHHVLFAAGASAAIRDTDDSRFYVESLSSTATAHAFSYSYRGAYTPYWTPRGFHEIRLVLAADTMIRRTHMRAQADAGVTRDRGSNFGPDEGPTALPANIYEFEFRRVYHPRHFQVSLTTPITSRTSIEVAVERSGTVFYQANGIRASLVRRR